MKVQFLKSSEPLCFNLKKWNVTQSPLLLITGLSGSGKTTFAKKFANQHHAICVSFDVLKFYSNSTKQSKKILNIFLKKYPEIKKHIYIQWSKTDKPYSNDILYNYYCNIFFDFLMEYSLRNKKRIILEGIQMFVRLHPSKSIGLPVIIIRQSSVRCYINKLKRDYLQKESIVGFKLIQSLIKDAFIYYIKQRKLLNAYTIYLFTVYKSNVCLEDNCE